MKNKRMRFLSKPGIPSSAIHLDTQNLGVQTQPLENFLETHFDDSRLVDLVVREHEVKGQEPMQQFGGKNDDNELKNHRSVKMCSVRGSNGAKLWAVSS